MWFKNLQLFRLSGDFTHSTTDIENKLTDHLFEPCGKTEPSRYGWVSPFGDHNDQLVHSAGGFLLLCAKKEERVLPAAVVREQLDERVAKIEAAEARKVYSLSLIHISEPTRPY